MGTSLEIHRQDGLAAQVTGSTADDVAAPASAARTPGACGIRAARRPCSRAGRGGARVGSPRRSFRPRPAAPRAAPPRRRSSPGRRSLRRRDELGFDELVAGQPELRSQVADSSPRVRPPTPVEPTTPPGATSPVCLSRYVEVEPCRAAPSVGDLRVPPPRRGGSCERSITTPSSSTQWPAGLPHRPHRDLQVVGARMIERLRRPRQARLHDDRGLSVDQPH